MSESLFLGKLQDLYNKGHPYSGYPGYIMMNMNNDSYMNNGSLSPPMPRTVSHTALSACSSSLWPPGLFFPHILYITLDVVWWTSICPTEIWLSGPFLSGQHLACIAALLLNQIISKMKTSHLLYCSPYIIVLMADYGKSMLPT